MKTTPELEAEIVRLHYAEHWKVGTIAAQLDTHPDVVRRVLGLSTTRPPSQLRPRLVDPYRPFIDETLQRYPKLLATRLYDMIRERGFTGSIRTLREHVAAVRPKRRREIYLLTETMAGEQAQVDWAYVDKLTVPGGERALWLFVMVLAHSRALWGRVRARPLGALARALAGPRVGVVRRRHQAMAARLCAAPHNRTYVAEPVTWPATFNLQLRQRIARSAGT